MAAMFFGHGCHDSWYDHGMVIMFFFEKKVDCLSTVTQIVATMYNYMAHFTGFRGIYAPKWRITKNKQRLLQKDFELSS